jgi:hypothetical protein
MTGELRVMVGGFATMPGRAFGDSLDQPVFFWLTRDLFLGFADTSG